MQDDLKLDGGPQAVIRIALYSTLAVNADQISAQSSLPGREHTTTIKDLCTQLRHTCRLLDTTGWTEQESTATLTVTDKLSVQLILDALHDELDILQDALADARHFNDTQAAKRLEQHCAQTSQAITATQATAQAAKKG